jgi:Protein kinase domain
MAFGCMSACPTAATAPSGALIIFDNVCSGRYKSIAGRIELLLWKGLRMDHSALPPGTRFTELEILRVVASGGFGIVYLARDHALDREVAVKEFMPRHLVERTDGDRVTVRLESDIEPFVLALRSFVNEAKLLARFSHPAMVKVHRFWEANGTAYMAMPFLHGPTLKAVRRSMFEAPTEAWLRSVIDPLLDALALLHTGGFYHRDIAPDNVILVDGRPVLLDFGSARRLVADRSGSLTAVLKPHYAPIEQYAESKQLRQGPWTDLYALGALIVYLLDGEPPPAATARSVHDEMNVQARRHVAGVSAEFLSAVDWALAVRPQERPQSVAQWRDALDGGKVGPAVAPAPPSGTALANVDAAVHCIGATGAEDVEVFARTVRWHPTRLTRKRRLWPALLAGAGLVVTAALVWPPALLTTMGRSTVRANAVPDSAMPPSVKPTEPLPASTAFDGTANPAPSEVVVAAATPAMQKKAAPAPMPQTPTAMAAKSSVAAVTARTPPPSRPAPRAKPKAIRVASPGPIELCAGRNFFVRPYCVQQQCDEKRFKKHPQCIQIREARTRRDY